MMIFIKIILQYAQSIKVWSVLSMQKLETNTIVQWHMERKFSRCFISAWDTTGINSIHRSEIDLKRQIPARFLYSAIHLTSQIGDDPVFDLEQIQQYICNKNKQR